jgi:hypothetical protein
MDRAANNKAICHLAWVIQDVTIENLVALDHDLEQLVVIEERNLGCTDPDWPFHLGLLWGNLRRSLRSREYLREQIDDSIEALLSGGEREVDLTRRRLRALLRGPYRYLPASPTRDQAQGIRKAISALGNALGDRYWDG